MVKFYGPIFGSVFYKPLLMQCDNLKPTIAVFDLIKVIFKEAVVLHNFHFKKGGGIHVSCKTWRGALNELRKLPREVSKSFGRIRDDRIMFLVLVFILTNKDLCVPPQIMRLVKDVISNHEYIQVVMRLDPSEIFTHRDHFKWGLNFITTYPDILEGEECARFKHFVLTKYKIGNETLSVDKKPMEIKSPRRPHRRIFEYALYFLKGPMKWSKYKNVPKLLLKLGASKNPMYPSNKGYVKFMYMNAQTRHLQLGDVEHIGTIGRQSFEDLNLRQIIENYKSDSKSGVVDLYQRRKDYLSELIKHRQCPDKKECFKGILSPEKNKPIDILCIDEKIRDCPEMIVFSINPLPYKTLRDFIRKRVKKKTIQILRNNNFPQNLLRIVVSYIE
jgi:hypothetical protein